ncbi:MAG: MFS transporter [Dehalococcoidia bacterium]
MAISIRLHRTALLRQPVFLLFWTGQTISAFGTQITALALPLTAVLTLGASPVQMGLLSAAHTGPLLILGLFAGVWVDRLRRRPILIAADLGRGMLLATIPPAALLGLLSMEQLYTVALGTGVLTTFGTVAHASFVPAVVGREYLTEGNSRLAMSSQAAGVLGPGLAGGLVQMVTAPVAILLDALSFAASAFCLIINRVSEVPPPTPKQREHVWNEIGQGLRFVWRNQMIRALCIATGTFNLFGGALWAVFVLYATRVLRVEPGALGVALAVGGCGGLLGALIAGHAVRRFGLGRVFLSALIVTGASVSLLPMAHVVPVAKAPLLTAQMLLFGLGNVIFSVNAVSLLQALTPERVLGRVTATTRIIAGGSSPIGVVVGGVLGGALGLPPTLWIVAAGVFLAVPWLWFSPVRTLRHIPVAGSGNASQGS